MGAGDIRAGGAYVELWADKKRLTQGLKESAQESKQWASQITALGAGLTALGAGLVAPFALSAKAFADNGSRIDDFAQRTGASVEAVSQLQYAAEQSGTGIDTLEKSMGKMSETISGAIQNEETAVAALQKLGLTAADLRGKLPEQQLSIFADKLAAISDVNVRLDLARAIFGKGGGDLIPLLSAGAAGIDQLRQRADRLGLTMSQEDATAAAAFGDSLDDLKSATMAIANAVGGALAPALKVGADLFVATVKPVTEFIKNNKILITTIAASGAAILAVGGTLTTIGLSMTLIGAALPGITALIGALSVAAPFIAGAVAIGAAGAALIHFTVGFRALLGAAQSTADGVLETFQGIANALQSGDWELALAIAGAGLSVGWLTILNGLKAGWRGFSDYIADQFSATLDVVLTELHAFATEFQAMTGVNIGKDFAGGLRSANNGGVDQRAKASQSAADKDNAQLTLAKAALKGLIDAATPEQRTSFGAVPEIDSLTKSKDKKDAAKSGKTDSTADAITARGALGLGGANTLQERMGADIRASLAELKGINQKAGRNVSGGKQATFASGQLPAGVSPDLLGPDVPPLDIKPSATPLHNPVAGNMLGITLPSDFKGGELAPQTPIRDQGQIKDRTLEERGVKAQEATAKETKRIADKAEQGILYGT